MASHALKSPSDVIDLLTDQHEQIKSLFTETLVLVDRLSGWLSRGGHSSLILPM